MADLLLRQPAVDANVVQREFGVTNPSALAAIAHLVEVGVLLQVSQGKWGRKWVAPTVLEALSLLDDWAAEADLVEDDAVQAMVDHYRL